MKRYIQPSIYAMEIHQNDSLMQASNPTGSTVFTDQNAESGAEGLSKEDGGSGHHFSIWGDDDEGQQPVYLYY